MLLLLLACSTAPTKTAPHVPVRVATVTVQDVPYILEGPGVVAPLQSASLQPQVSGAVRRVAFAEGDEVSAGQVLFELDPRPYRAALSRAQAVLAHDEEQLAQTRREAERRDALAVGRDLTVEEAEQKRSEVAALTATVAADRAAVEAAKLDVEHATIRAPFAGRTGAVRVHVGDSVRAGDPALVDLVALAPIAVELHVPQASLAEVAAGLSGGLSVEATLDGATHTGTLSFLDVAVDPSTGTVLAKARFANEDHALWPGAYVQTRLLLRTETDRLVVPASALTTGQSGTTAWVIADGTASPRPVTVARIAGNNALIRTGLSAGEVVVSDGQLRLSPGATVDILPAAGAAGAPTGAPSGAPPAPGAPEPGPPK